MPKIAVDTGEVYGATEAAKLIGIGYATLYRWLKSGKLISIKLAGRTLIPKTEVERLKTERAPVSEGAPISKNRGER
jgi:excisionase family DNA binding protein